MSRRLTIALALRETEESNAAAEALQTLYRVRRPRDAETVPPDLEADLLAIEVDPKDTKGLSAVARFREAQPDVPILLLGRNLDVDLGVELVKLLGDDFLSAPVQRMRELKLKVERLMLGRDGPTLERPVLRSLIGQNHKSESEKRRAHRAGVPPGWQALARIEGTRMPVLARLMDLTIALPDWPGAVRLALSRQTASAIVQERLIPDWGRGARFSAAFTLERSNRELTLDLHVVRMRKPTKANEFPFVARYATRSEKDNEELILFWTRCQAAGVRERRRESREAA